MSEKIVQLLHQNIILYLLHAQSRFLPAVVNSRAFVMPCAPVAVGQAKFCSLYFTAKVRRIEHFSGCPVSKEDTGLCVAQ